jgi:hypothetical protein
MTAAGTQADSGLAATERRMRSLGADALLSTLVYNHCTTATVCLVLHPSMARGLAGGMTEAEGSAASVSC